VGRQGTTKLQDSEARPTLGHDGGDAKPLRTQRLTAISCPRAKVAELADAQDSGSCGLNTRGGSSPPFRTQLNARTGSGSSILRSVTLLATGPVVPQCRALTVRHSARRSFAGVGLATLGLVPPFHVEGP